MRTLFGSTFGRTALVAGILSCGMLSWGIAQASSGGQNTLPGASAGRSAAAAEYGNAPGMPPTAQVLWAVVNSNGTLARSFPFAGSNSVKGKTGAYEVVFPGNFLSNCSFQVTLGETTSKGSVDGFGTAEGASTNASAAYVNTFNKSGGAAAEPFHLAVLC